MAGSLKAMTYTSDTGVNYTVMIDESNGEACGYTAYDGHPPLPRQIQRRYALAYAQEASTIKRKLTFGTLAAWNARKASPTFDLEPYPGIVAIPFVCTFFSGEKLTILTGVDTAINDGDNP